MIDSTIIKDAGVPGLAYKVTVHHDRDTMPFDFDCYTSRQIRAWSKYEWQFTGIIVTPVIAGFDVESCDASLWGVEYGDFLVTDENDEGDERRDITLSGMVAGYAECDEGRAHPVNELIEEARRNLTDNLGPVIDALRKHADALKAVQGELSRSAA